MSKYYIICLLHISAQINTPLKSAQRDSPLIRVVRDLVKDTAMLLCLDKREGCLSTLSLRGYHFTGILLVISRLLVSIKTVLCWHTSLSSGDVL